MPLDLSTVFSNYRIRHEDVWIMDLPALSFICKNSANDLSGTFSIEYPNPLGFAKDRFEHFDKMEFFIKDLQTNTLLKTMTGQINRIDATSKKGVIGIEGRGLSGLLSDPKVNGSWRNRRVEYILCEPNFGIIAEYFQGRITTWNAFTNRFDRFDYWNSDYWGTQESWTNIFNGELEVQGAGGSTRRITGTSSYVYEVFEIRAKVDTAANSIRFGFRNSTGTDYVRFELNAAGINTETAASSTETSTAVTSPPSQTSYRHYRIEWANEQVMFFIDGVLYNTHTTNVSNLELSPFFEVDNNTSLLTIDYIKEIILTRELGGYLAKNKIASDVCTDLCDVGTDTDSFTYFIDDDFDFNSTIVESVPTGLGFGLRSSLYTTNAEQIMKIELNEEAKDLYNSVRVEGGDRYVEYGGTFVETKEGDGKTTSFILGYKADKPMVEVEVNGVPVVENTDYTVNYGTQNTVITFTSLVPGAGQDIDLGYNYFLPIIATANNTASQLQYGVKRVYTKVDDTIIDQTRAFNFAQALLSYFSDPRTVIKVTVPIRPALKIGNTVTIDAPDQKIDNTLYEIIELEHSIGLSGAVTTMTLADQDIDTNAEILREILQQLKAIRTKGDTDSTVVEQYPLTDNVALSEGLDLQRTWICDSFIVGHPDDNGRLGIGTILDEFESSVVANWTGSGFTVAAESTTYRVGSAAMNLSYASSGTHTVTSTQSFGDLSSFVGVSSGTPTFGGVGIWVYLANSADISSGSLRLGSSASDYVDTSFVVFGTGNVLRSGWNYLVAYMDGGSVTGTPNWTAVDYCRLSFVVNSGSAIIVDYLTISLSDLASPNRIGLNGLGRRVVSSSSTIL